MEKETLRDALHHINVSRRDADIYVDATDFGIAVCHPVRLTDSGMTKWGDLLDMEMCGGVVCGTDKDYDDYDKFDEENIGDGGRLVRAGQFLRALAGCCTTHKFNEWFTGGREI